MTIHKQQPWRFSRCGRFARRWCWWVLSLSLLSFPAWAQDGADWNELSTQEQRLLAPLQDDWNGLSPQRQERLLNGARRWQSLSPEDRRQAQQNFRDWSSRSPEQRTQIRERFQRFNALPPERQRFLRERFQDFQNLPEDRRRTLREQFRNRPPPGARPGVSPRPVPPRGESRSNPSRRQQRPPGNR